MNVPHRIGVRIQPARGVAADQLASLPELAVQAESLGFEMLVVPELLSADGGVPAALPACAAAAAVTRTLRIATGLLALPLHHPLRVAEDAATLDGLSGGRLELGVGLGAEADAFGGFGLALHERGRRFEEALEVLRRAWRAGPVRFEGEHFRCGEIEVHPKPVQPDGPPLWVGARSAEALARAADLAVGVVVEEGTDPAPYLAAWSHREVKPRVAFLHDGEAGDAAGFSARLGAASRAQVDIWLALRDPSDLPRLAEAADRLRQRGP
jgi:alkanesulfonate monooxygenase SsuD/methylene tetrahydromethanopterin reductase-like flavin-dependent oxidoreductase (luciferase family)